MKRLTIFALAAATLALAACDTPQYKAQREAELRAANRAAFVPQNALDFDNYDRRLRLSDDPTTIVWCSAAFPTPGAPIITVPIVGKLTSGGKRPFGTDPGPDGMYGSSGEYRYGFTPGGNMVDFTGIATFCTTEPTVWQREATTIVVAQDPGLAAASATAQRALAGKIGQPNAEAAALAALTSATQGRRAPQPTAPAPVAAPAQ